MPTAAPQGGILILLKVLIAVSPNRYPRSGKLGLYHIFPCDRPGGGNKLNKRPIPIVRPETAAILAARMDNRRLARCYGTSTHTLKNLNAGLPPAGTSATVAIQIKPVLSER